MFFNFMLIIFVMVIIILITYIATIHNKLEIDITKTSRLIIRKRIDQALVKDIDTILKALDLPANDRQKALEILSAFGAMLDVDYKKINYDIKLLEMLSVNKKELIDNGVRFNKKYDNCPIFEPFANDFELLLDHIIDQEKEEAVFSKLGIRYKIEQILDYYLSMTMKQFIHFCLPIAKEKIKVQF